MDNLQKNKRGLLIVFAVAFLAVVVVLGVGIWFVIHPPQPEPYLNIIRGESSDGLHIETIQDMSSIVTGASFKVTRVIDGDTIEIEGGERVRYIGIDTPETVDPRKPVQCFGVEASKKNKELVEGKHVRLERDITERDRYNRLLRYVWVDDTFINLELVRQGFAHSYSYPPDIKYQDQFIAAEREAREARSGLGRIICSKQRS